MNANNVAANDNVRVAPTEPITEIDAGMRQVSMACLKWKIKKFSTLRLKPNDFICSRIVVCSGIKWQLILYPNGQSHKNNVGNIAVYLKKMSLKPKCINVFYKICIESKNGEQYFSSSRDRAFKDKHGHGVKSLVKTNVLFGVLKDDLLPSGTLTLYCEFCQRDTFATKVTSQTLGIETNSLPMISCFNALANDICDINEKNRWCDVILKVKDQEFLSHKAILGARSPVFSRMFLHNFEENRSNRVFINDMEPSAVKNMLEYIYTGSVSKLPVNDLMDLYVAADRYALDELKEKCFSIMLLNFDVSNICDFISFSDTYNDDNLKNDSVNFFSKNASLVIMTNKWKSFARSYPLLAQHSLERAVMCLATKKEKE